MPTYAVISDVHGNYEALQEVLTYLKDIRPDGVICLGDYITDSPYPERTMKLLYQMMETYPCEMVRGNREQYMIRNAHSDKGFHPSTANGALYYTAKHLSKEDIAFFETLPIDKTIMLPNCPQTTICHGAPGDLRGNFYENPDYKDKVLKAFNSPYLFGGHSHHQEIDTRFHTIYLNPGSLGMAIDGIGKRAQFALVETKPSTAGSKQIQYHMKLMSIPYNVERFLQDFTTSGIEECGMMMTKAVKKTLVTGINYFIYLINEVNKANKDASTSPTEELWEELARKIGII